MSAREKDMTEQSDFESEHVFRKLPEYGYSEKAAALVWRWYHPSKNKK
jgi:hypothetical protein